MPEVFAAHPFLSTGATSVDTRGKVVTAGLYLDPNGPHPINAFGCTICHGGQGSGTDFTFASHTPANLEEEEHWKKAYGWQEIHHWDYPMLPQRFVESSCVKCHHQITDIPQAKKLQAGYQRIVQYGCTGCHTIGGEGSFGPDLTDERTVGPNLGHVGSKVSREWVVRWIKNPHAFRPDSRMPRFYGLTNNDAKDDLPKSDAEIQAITHYLFTRSTPPADFVDPPAKTDPKRGKELFLQKGCLACHQHRPYDASMVQQADQKNLNPEYKPDPAATYDPKTFPEPVRTYAQADYGPNLGNLAAKFRSEPDKGMKWLSNWIQNPEKYHPKSLMPNFQLPFQDAADIASWLISVPGDWPVKVCGRTRPGQGGCHRPRRSGQALCHQGRIQDEGRQVGLGGPERGRGVRRQAQHRRQALLPGGEDHRAAGLLRLPRDPGIRERQADRHPAQRLGPQEPRRGSTTATSGSTWKTRRRRTTATGMAPTRSIRSRSSTRRGSASCTRSCTGRGATTT